MKKPLLVLSLIFIHYSFLYGQIVYRSPFIGFAAYSPAHADVFSFIANPAALAAIKNISAGLFSERRYMLAELNACKAAIGMPTTSGNFALKAGYSGFISYNEIQAGLVYARNIGTKACIGAAFDYNGISMAGYGSASVITAAVGALLHITKAFHAGFHAGNLAAGKLGKYKQEKVPSTYSIGFGYDPSEKFCSSIEIIKEENQPVHIHAGMEYRLVERLFLRGGIISSIASTWIGVGLLIKSFRLGIYSSYHPQLGMSPGLSMIFDLKKRKE